jgi:flagellar basal-body rod modification protein FlgD
MSSIAATGEALFASTASAQDRLPLKQLGQDDFLKLLVTQLTNQDPMQPQSDLEFIGQMASFTSLEQTRSMVSDMALMRTDQELLRANALIGRTVEVDAGEGLRHYGNVTAVHMEAGKPKVVVGEHHYDLSQLRIITAPGAPA